MSTLSKDDEQFFTGMMAGILLRHRWPYGEGADVLLSQIIESRDELKRIVSLPLWRKAVQWAEETDKLMNKR